MWSTPGIITCGRKRPYAGLGTGWFAPGTVGDRGQRACLPWRQFHRELTAEVYLWSLPAARGIRPSILNEEKRVTSVSNTVSNTLGETGLWRLVVGELDI